MKRYAVIAAVFVVCLMGLAVPALAGDYYDNGPINGTSDAWTINFGFAPSNSFRICCRQADPAGGAITGLMFGAWLMPGDVLQSAEVLMGSSEFDGSLFDQVVNFTQSGCSANQYGFNVCTETGMFSGPNLADGTYWLTLENATVNTGDPVYWDENEGPSSASENSLGTIPSESFTILGAGVTSSTSSSGGTVPEPSSVLLFGSGVLGMLGVVRRRFMR